MDENKYEDGRLYDTGDMIGELEVTGVSYQERENPETGEVEKYNFTYHTQDPKDVEKAPEHGQELTAEQIQADREAQNAQVADEMSAQADEPAATEEPQDGESLPAEQ